MMTTSGKSEQRKVWSEPKMTGRSEIKNAQAAKDVNLNLEGVNDGLSTGPLS